MSEYREPARTWQRLNSADRAWVPWVKEANPSGVRPSKVPAKDRVVVHPDQTGLDLGQEPPPRNPVDLQTSMMEVEIVRCVGQDKPIGRLKSNHPYLRYQGRDMEIKGLVGVEIVAGLPPLEPETESNPSAWNIWNIE